MRRQYQQRNVPKKAAGGGSRFTKSILFKQIILFDKAEKNNSQHEIKNRIGRAFNPDNFVERICHGLQE